MTLATVTSDLVLPPHGFFLVADSSEPVTNHALPGTVVTWGTGTGSDVLLNSGDTVVLYTATATIDSITYPTPSMLVDGASMAFPSNCDPSLRGAFGNWQPSVASWTPGYFGTPSGPNLDVRCPVAPPPPPTASPLLGLRPDRGRGFQFGGPTTKFLIVSAPMGPDTRASLAGDRV